MADNNNIGGQIYRYNNDLLLFDQMMEETGGELTPEAEAQLTKVMNEGTSIATNFHAFAANKKVFIEGCKAAKKEIGERQKTAEKSLENAKAWLLNTMMKGGVEKIEDGINKVTVGAGRESVEILSEDAILSPYAGRIQELIASLPDYIMVKVEISKSALGDALKRGDLVNGAEIVRNPSLMIK